MVAIVARRDSVAGSCIRAPLPDETLLLRTQAYAGKETEAVKAAFNSCEIQTAEENISETGANPGDRRKVKQVMTSFQLVRLDDVPLGQITSADRKFVTAQDNRDVVGSA